MIWQITLLFLWDLDLDFKTLKYDSALWYEVTWVREMIVGFFIARLCIKWLNLPWEIFMFIQDKCRCHCYDYIFWFFHQSV